VRFVGWISTAYNCPESAKKCQTFSASQTEKVFPWHKTFLEDYTINKLIELGPIKRWHCRTKNNAKVFRLKNFGVVWSPNSAGSLQFPDHPESTQEIRFFGKIGFLKPCPRYPGNPIFWKNRISQTVCPNVPKKSDYLIF
jgi:hypothetical protein